MKLLAKGAIAAAAIAFAGAANAAEVFHVTLWTGVPNGVDSSTIADEAHVPTGTAFASFDWTGPINWFVGGPQNTDASGNKIGDFLGSSAPISNFVSGISEAAFLDTSLSQAGDAFASFFRITGSYVSASDFHGVISHDDGASIYVDGSPIYTSAAETSEVSANYTLVAGSHSFVVDYVEGNGSPSVLTFDAPGGVPEPATWAMMMVGFGGMGALLRSRRRMVAA